MDDRQKWLGLVGSLEVLYQASAKIQINKNEEFWEVQGGIERYPIQLSNKYNAQDKSIYTVLSSLSLIANF